MSKNKKEHDDLCVEIEKNNHVNIFCIFFIPLQYITNTKTMTKHPQLRTFILLEQLETIQTK